MADDRRVEARATLVGMGMGVTPEKIAEIEQRARQAEKLSRPPPQQAFSAVLRKRTGETPAAEPTAKEKKQAALPKKGPRPKLSHPGQREAYGRDASDEDTIVIKG